MPTQVLMPALSPTMEEGKLAKWVKSEGDEVRSGDVIAEIETDKATMEVEAVDEGKLGKILVPAGTEGVKVNTPIAVILSDGEDASALANGMRRRRPIGAGGPLPRRGTGELRVALARRSNGCSPSPTRGRACHVRRDSRRAALRSLPPMTAPPRSPKARKWCR